MFKFKVGDEVVITSGRDKGKKGKIEKVLKTENKQSFSSNKQSFSANKIVVAGVAIYKRHRKVSRQSPAGIYEITRPIDVAKVAIICPKCGKQTRVGITLEGKTKVRICKKCQGRLL